ncbi:hypothetical protein HDV00_009526 [Rhizophlyctis rosea]|nr:hypothetical protein HDV00_009526 [Rhizophlyctis rosea]
MRICVANMCLERRKVEETAVILLDLAQHMEMAEAAAPPSYPIVAIINFNLARLHHLQSRYDLAEPLFADSFQKATQSLGEVDETIAMRFDFAQMYRDMGDYEKAESWLRDCVERSGRLFEESHPKRKLFRERLNTFLKEKAERIERGEGGVSAVTEMGADEA